MGLDRVQNRIALPLRQSCAAGDAVSIVVSQLPPEAAGDRDLLRVEVDAEFDNNRRHRIGTLLSHPRPRAGARVLGTACVPGAIGYFATFYLDSSRDGTVQVGLQQSIGGADYGLRNLDLRDEPDSESASVEDSTPVLGRSFLTPGACVVAEVYGRNRTTDAYIQLHDAQTIAAGPPFAIPFDEWWVPAGSTFHRALPATVIRNRLIVARSQTAGLFDPELTGSHAVRARLLVR